MEFDATTAVLFHTLAVIIFEIIFNGAATFNHSNINIPPMIDKKLRWPIITPDMHRIHHSTLHTETDSNYGFSISCWDRLCKIYIAEPRQSQAIMTIGLEPFRQQNELGFMQ